MYTLDDIANYVIQNLSNASVNVTGIKDDLFKYITTETKIDEDAQAMLYFLKKAVHITEVIANKKNFIKIYDLKTATNLDIITTDKVKVPCLLFKLPDAPICYVNKRVIAFLTETLEQYPEIEFKLTFKCNFKYDSYVTIVRFRKNINIRRMALKHKLHSRDYKNLTLCYC